MDGRVDRKWRRHVIYRQILSQCLKIERRPHRRVREQDFRLRREEQVFIKNAPIKRLLAEAIARQQQPATLRVPQRKSEHSIEMLEHIRAVFFVKMWEDFCVRRAAK